MRGGTMKSGTMKSGATTAVLECERLGRAFGEAVAVEAVSFSMAAGESVALIGSNGAGKSTTLGMITTAIRPDRGRCRVLGADVVAAPRAARAALGVLFQEPALDGRLSARETLGLHAVLHGVPRRELRERVAAAIDWAELGAVADTLVQKLSGGTRRRIELARALLHEPALLVLDEPTIGLDPQGQRDLWTRIGELRGGGLAVLLTTHVLHEAERCDRVGVLDRGRLVAIDTPEALKRGVVGHATASLEDVFMVLTGAMPRPLGPEPPRPVLVRSRA